MLSDGVILLHGNTHTALKTQELLRKFKWEVWSHPPNSPDSTPSLGSKHLSGTRLSSDGDEKTAAENWLNGLGRHFCQAGLNKSVLRSDKRLLLLLMVVPEDQKSCIRSMSLCTQKKYKVNRELETRSCLESLRHARI
ncbi:hypothetical protein AVEN_139206-1 [Araneus ventricosus]|uniref:Uncharacterized protein n=1 Tax=Araneus ventricosus TaxID=182803 RepID=A0A4Y2UTI9_ARAVE|nr:hypothetical protein AVEN_139206-1 [Araneus ventricosus]